MPHCSRPVCDAEAELQDDGLLGLEDRAPIPDAKVHGEIRVGTDEAGWSGSYGD